MARLALKIIRYIQCYGELAFGGKPKTLEEAVDYCVDRPVLMAQVRSEIMELGKVLQEAAPRRSLEIGTNYGGTLLLLCTVSPQDAKIISLDLPAGQFGGGYPRRKMPLFRQFPRTGQQLHLIRGDSHVQETKDSVVKILRGEPLDFLFIDADHTYAGVQQDFKTYSPLVRSGGIVAFHDIVAYSPGTKSEVAKFWSEIKNHYRHREFIQNEDRGTAPVAITGASMETAGLGVLYMP